MSGNRLVATLLATGLLAALTMPVTSRADGASKSDMLAGVCTSCHGPNGKGAMKVPDLTDLELKDFVLTMKGFKTGEEKSTIMDRIAKSFTDEEIELLAKHFIALK